MGIWNRMKLLWETRALDETALDDALRAVLGRTAVTVKSAMSVPAVSAAVSLISGAVASLPVKLYRTEDGKSTEVTDDYRLQLLNRETGDLLDAFQWKSTLIRDYLLPGGGYTYVDWNGTAISGLYYLAPNQVSVEVGADPIYKTARFYVGGRPLWDFEVLRVLRNTADGATGTGLVAESPVLLETMLSALKYEWRMVRTGAKKGFLEAERTVDEAAAKDLKAQWRNMYGSDSEETVVVLNNGLKFHDAGQTAVDTQLNENKVTNDREVYKIFGISPPVLEGGADAEDLKNTVRFAIDPPARALESALNRFCLLEEEKGALTFELDRDALDSTDILTRYQAYEVALKNGWLQTDEVRYEEGRDPLGMKYIRLGLDTVLYDPDTGRVYTPNTKEWMDLKGGGEKIES